MQKKFYLDTSIWRDYFEDRSDGVRPLGEFAFQFLKNCAKKGFTILVSDTVILELKKDFSEEQISDFFNPFESIIVHIAAVSEQYAEAKKEWLQNKAIPLNDFLHAIIARDNNAILISRDRHFAELLSLVESKLPEEVILD
ncbi:MAG: PIN domain-containing protein [Candidatus ainarchaeum sp.]|nr:PIN domain-containing protein [Candidatus ainarchaeum sp.]